MYNGEPTVSLGAVSRGELSSSSRAMPKSTIVRCPRADTMRLLGLMSRCTTPIACAAASPEQACLAMRSTLSTGNIPRPLACRWRSMAAIEIPSASSITMNSSLPTRPASRAEMMLGCLSRASVSASRRNRAMVSPTTHLVIDVGELDELDGNRLARGQVPAAPDLAHRSAAERELKLVSPH